LLKERQLLLLDFDDPASQLPEFGIGRGVAKGESWQKERDCDQASHHQSKSNSFWCAGRCLPTPVLVARG